MNNKGFTSIEMVICIVVLLAIVGEGLCIYKFFSCDFEPSYKAEAIYGVSLVTGFGAVTGYMDFGK